jgi:general secretion pathway protein A
MPAASATVAIADEPQAWRELAAVWGLSLVAGDPCVAAARQQVQCFRGSGGLALIRQLDRPGIVTLRDGDGRRAYALLVGLGNDSVTLRLAGGGLQTVPLAELARLWRGDFATFWRAPPGYEAGRAGPLPAALADWLSPRLPDPPPAPPGAAALPREDILRAQVQAFQLTQGIKPDGLAGPLTLMLVNRASGVAEPRLQPER